MTVQEKVNRRKRERFVWTEKRIKVLKSMYEQQRSYESIAQRMGAPCQRWNVRDRVRKLIASGEMELRPGPARRSNLWSLEDDKRLENLYVKQRKGVRFVADALGRTYDGVASRINRMGLNRRVNNPRNGWQVASEQRSWRKSVRSLQRAKSEKARAKLYNGLRYEDANVPERVPACGRIG